MGTDLRAFSAEVRRLYELSDEITGLCVSELCTSGPIERLTSTDVAQPAVVTTSLAALSVLRAQLAFHVTAVAGHSVGEYSAYAAAGVFDTATTLRLVHARAQAMTFACDQVDGTMAAVIGIDEGPLRRACTDVSENGSSVEVANLNAPGNLIVSGDRGAIERLSERARQAGARRVVPLNVGGPFHSVYMRPATDALLASLDQAPLSPAKFPVVGNASARPMQSAAELEDELAVQIYSPVRWIETLEVLAGLGCDRFLEVGPGKVLAGLVKRTLPDAQVASFGSLADLPAAQKLLAG
jgi:[acyl-carrier-protein] S-malonyltransferase